MQLDTYQVSILALVSDLSGQGTVFPSLDLQHYPLDTLREWRCIVSKFINSTLMHPDVVHTLCQIRLSLDEEIKTKEAFVAKRAEEILANKISQLDLKVGDHVSTYSRQIPAILRGSDPVTNRSRQFIVLAIDGEKAILTPGSQTFISGTSNKYNTAYISKTFRTQYSVPILEIFGK